MRAKLLNPGTAGGKIGVFLKGRVAYAALSLVLMVWWGVGCWRTDKRVSRPNKDGSRCRCRTEQYKLRLGMRVSVETRSEQRGDSTRGEETSGRRGASRVKESSSVQTGTWWITRWDLEIVDCGHARIRLAVLVLDFPSASNGHQPTWWQWWWIVADKQPSYLVRFFTDSYLGVYSRDVHCIN